MDRIRVLQVLANFSLGGAERMAVHLIRHLDPARFEVAAISLYAPLGTDLERMLADAGHTVFYLGKRPGFRPGMFLAVNRVIRRFRPQVVHTHTGGLRYALPAMLWRRVPAKVHTIHNPADKDQAPFLWLYRYAVRRGVVPVAIADEIYASALRVYGLAKCPNIPNGIPVASYRSPQVPRAAWRAHEGYDETDVLFACVGRLAPQKNHALLLAAFAKLVAADARCRLMIVGEGELRSALEAQVAQLDLGDHVRLPGLRTDIPDVLAAADAFVLSSAYEGNPLTVMEALAAGRPVLSTAVGGVPELVRDGVTGLLTPPGDADALGAAMARIATDPATARAMGEAATREAMERFDVGIMAQAYGRLYEDLLAGRYASIVVRDDASAGATTAASG